MSDAGADLSCDVCVVGGGPAGATAAIRLAQLGHSVVVVERARFPRPRVGESLPASVLPLLDVLGVRGAVERAGFLRPRRTLVRWLGVIEVAHDAGDPALQVDRARFDAMLLDAARVAGARVVMPARAARERETADGWMMSTTCDDGGAARGETRVHARFLIDAAGRRGASPGVRTAALHAYWEDTNLDGPETRVEALDAGWSWAAPLPNRAVSAAVFVDAAACASLDATAREALYRARLAETALLRGCLDGRMRGAVRVHDASPWADPRPAGPTFARAGDAACRLDPLSSQGVQAAIHSALAAAAVAHTCLTRPANAPLAVDFYTRRQREHEDHHARIAARYYAARAALTPTPFWRARSASHLDGAASAPPPAREPLSTPAPRDGCALRLSSATRIVPRPILAGDTVVAGETLEHPALERAVAYLGPLSVAPLVRALDASGADTPVAIVTRWRAVAAAPPDACWAALDWLFRHRVVVVAN